MLLFLQVLEKNKELIGELENIYKDNKNHNPNNYKQIDYKKSLTRVGRVSLITNPIDVYSKQPLAFYQIRELMKGVKKIYLVKKFLK